MEKLIEWENMTVEEWKKLNPEHYNEIMKKYSDNENRPPHNAKDLPSVWWLLPFYVL